MSLGHRANQAERRVSDRRPRQLPRDFWRLWGGFLFASTGDGFALGAVPLLAVAVDPKPLAVSAVVAANGLPWLLAALPAGAFADRFERRRVIMGANLLRALLAGLVAVLLVVRRMDLVLLLVAVIVNAAARAIYYSAVQASVPEIVGPTRLGRANGILGGTEVVSEHLGGPIVGAWLFTVIRSIPFFGEAATMAFSALPFSVSKTNLRPPARSGTVWDGARQLWKDRRLRVLMTLIASLAGLQGLVTGVLVLVATRDWGIRPSEYGLFLAAGAAGNLPGALLASRFASRFGSAACLLGAAVVAGGCYMAMAVARGWLIAGAAFFLAGFVIGVGVVVSQTLRQLLSPPELMGRVGAAWRGIAWGAAPTGALVAGSIALFGGLRVPLMLAGVAQCVLALVLAIPLLRRLGRQLERGGVLVAGSAAISGGEEPIETAGAVAP